MSSSTTTKNNNNTIKVSVNNTNKAAKIEIASTKLYRLLHQTSSLDVVSNNNGAAWHARGETTLYVIGDANNPSALSFHSRSSVCVQSVTVQALSSNSDNHYSLQILESDWYQADPLSQLFVSDISRNTTNDYHADAFASVKNVTDHVRAASMASELGTLRLRVAAPAPLPNSSDEPTNNGAVKTAWQEHLSRHCAVQSDHSQYDRCVTRLDTVANALAEASTGRANVAFVVTISYELQHLPQTLHATPTILYTVSGTYGDTEGPRLWLPTLDSASVLHRASHNLTIKVSAPMMMGLSTVGCGEDFGRSQTYLYDGTSNQQALVETLGAAHTKMLEEVRAVAPLPLRSSSHVVEPTDDDDNHLSLDSIWATNCWTSATWTPIPVRSLGFAIGPFCVLEDPEYFGPARVLDPDDDDDEDNDVSLEERTHQFIQTARARGEGIRNVYLAPLFDRKFIHVTANRLLLPNTTIRLRPLTASQTKLSKQLQETVLSATTGVPHRALSLMRDVLALPNYRTSSFTQIWIPNAVHGGCTSGSLHHCPEVNVNPFLGGAVMDSRLLPPTQTRLPFYQGGRVLQFLQARNAVRGWIVAALPLGGHDDVGMGYLLSLVESFIMSLYERGHGGQGEGGARDSQFFSKRFSTGCGLNSVNLDFLPVQNIEDTDLVIEGVGAVPVEDRHNEQLWRGSNNGSESHTSAMDEFNARQLLCRDGVEALERGTDKDKTVPSPSMGWLGSYLSLSFFSSNAASSSDLGCGAVELLHPIGGLVYRAMKSEVFRGVVEGRAGVANFIRLVRAAFIAGHLDDIGEKELKIKKRKKKSDITDGQPGKIEEAEDVKQSAQPFVVCVNEILKKRGLTHTLFTRALQNLSGRIKEPQLLGTLVDAERHAEDPRTRRPFVDPEGFPNSYVRGASLLYCRVGVQVEAAKDSTGQAQASVTKGIQMHSYAEPVIPEGGIAYGGPITIRVVENEGSFREYVKDLGADGSRRDWGASFLHAKPVTTLKAQTAAGGAIESSSKDSAKSQRTKVATLDSPVTSSAFTENDFHAGGYQAIELIRLTNLTPLLWVRADPMGLFGGRISVFQPDACLAEQLFHDGDSGAQIDAIRALAERPLMIQGTAKVTTVYDVPVAELPVRVIGDCLRGSPALHSSLPHTPTVRYHAALCIAQWQNNKAPPNKDTVGSDNWVGINLLVQYFRERHYSSSDVMPAKFTRPVLKKSEAEVQKAASAEGTVPNAQSAYGDLYQYIDLVDPEDRKTALETAESVEIEEDEEYRVRSAVVTGIACIRAKDGMTPPLAVQFLEAVLESEDAEMAGSLAYTDEELLIGDLFKKNKATYKGNVSDSDEEMLPLNNKRSSSLRYLSSMLVADALMALCYVNSMPAIITDPTTGKTVQSSGSHPLSRLLKVARNWLDWELYRENLRLKVGQETQVGVSGNCHDLISCCAIVALANVTILIQSTTDPFSIDSSKEDASERAKITEPSSGTFYTDIFDAQPQRNDLTRAAAAQAFVCICCAADRFENGPTTDDNTSVGLRHTLALLMMDACTGKICSMQRIGAIAGRNDLISTLARFYNGPLGACHGGDNGSALLMTVSGATLPAATAVNDGARRGMRLLTRAGHPKETSIKEELIVRVALFATKLWRTINGEHAEPSENSPEKVGVCAFDGALRCSLLALWQWVWPKGCWAAMQVQSWRPNDRLNAMGAHRVMRYTEKEMAVADAESKSIADVARMVDVERDRQAWRGEMARTAYEMYKSSKGSAVQDVAAAEKGIGIPLPPIARDVAFKSGGWIASAAQQRRALALDGGTAVTKLRLKVKGSD